MTPERKQRIETVLNHRQPGLTVVLENVADPHNISAVMRTCDAVGIQEIFILNNAIPKHKKWGAKSSSSAAKWLTIHQFQDTAECFSTLNLRFENIFATHLSKNAVSLYEMDFVKNTALVFGNEHSGVSEVALSFCNGNFHIPQVGIIKSLNISVACAVSIYEAFRQKEAAGHYTSPQLSEIEKKTLSQNWGMLSTDSY